MRGEGISREIAERCGAYLWKHSGVDEAIAVSAMIGCDCSECQNLLSRFKLLRILDKHMGDIAITAQKRN